MTGTEPATPVFVDPTGRRARWAHALFVTLGALASLYVATVALSLFLPAGALHLSIPGLGPVLPGPAPAQVTVTEGGKKGGHPRRLAGLIPTAEPVIEVPQTPGPVRTSSPTSGGRPGSSPTALPGPATPAATATPTRPTATPTSTSKATGSPTSSSRPTPTPANSPKPRPSKTPAPHPTRSPR